VNALKAGLMDFHLFRLQIAENSVRYCHVEVINDIGMAGMQEDFGRGSIMSKYIHSFNMLYTAKHKHYSINKHLARNKVSLNLSTYIFFCPKQHPMASSINDDDLIKICTFSNLMYTVPSP